MSVTNQRSSPLLTSELEPTGWRYSGSEFFIMTMTKTIWTYLDLYAYLLQIRWWSGCVAVVTGSSDTNFLASLAEESSQGHLLVWPSRLVVITQLARHLVQTLLQQHWTMSMINSVLLNLEDHLGYSKYNNYALIVFTVTWVHPH